MKQANCVDRIEGLKRRASAASHLLSISEAISTRRPLRHWRFALLKVDLGFRHNADIPCWPPCRGPLETLLNLLESAGISNGFASKIGATLHCRNGRDSRFDEFSLSRESRLSRSRSSKKLSAHWLRGNYPERDQQQRVFFFCIAPLGIPGALITIGI